MDLYFTRHDGQAATVEQFVQCFADVSGRDLTQFMRWYSQAGTPEIEVAPHYDARAKTYRLDITQTVPPTPGQPDKEPMVIPLALGLVGKNGGDLPLMLDGRPLARGVIELTEPSQSFRLHRRRRTADPFAQSRLFGADQARAADRSRRSAFPRRPRSRSVQPLAGGADAGDDAFDRPTSRRCAPARAGARGRRPHGRARRDPRGRRARAGLHRADADAAEREPTSPARSAATSIPMRSLPRAGKLRAAIGERLGAGAGRHLSAHDHARPLSAGRRERRTARAQERLPRSFGGDARRARRSRARLRNTQSADNMTDRMAALETLALHDRPERAQALDDFYRRYADDPLIIDKWLALQAAIPEAGDARPRARADRASGLLHGQSQPRARADRLVRASQPHPIQPARRRRLRFRRRCRARARSEEPASRRAADGRVPFLAGARSRRAAPAPRRRLRRVAAAPSLSRDVHDIVARTLAES